MTEETKRYNGWTNYETWAANLWLSNDEGSWSYWTERAQEVYDNAQPANASWTKKEHAAEDLAGELKSQHEEEADALLQGASLYSDLLTAALSEINWNEIAAALLEDVEETEEVESGN